MTNYITKTIKNGVEANIPVTSVNGQYGDVVVAGKEYNAGDGIAIGTVHSDMQGPAPDGFHVPSKDELEGLLQAIENIFGYAGLNMVTYLKMPMAGYRYNIDDDPFDPSADVFSEGSQGFYWSSSASSTENSYSLWIQEEDMVELANRTYRSRGCSIRCFKDNPVTPDSGWTTLYSNTIYHNSSLGLISIKNGDVWITISDKNLGATQVWNSGDTLTDANCGYFYQRGNNYGFPHSGEITTSGTEVNTSSYGPGNYYNSSTFITYPGNWSNPQNDNLWGGVTQGTWIGGDGNTITNTGVLSVNGQTGDVTIESGGIQNDTTGTTSTVTKIRAGSEAEYNALSSKDATTIYHVF